MTSLINPNATARTQSLYALIQRLQGEKMIIAQQESPNRRGHWLELDWIEAVTGTLPAMLGLDFIHDDYEGVVERAKQWNDRGGIVTICWHTGVEGIDYPSSKNEAPDWDRLLTSGTEENSLLRRRWDDAANALLKIQEADIPVLWRPFHEFDGQWFWWGKGGGDCFIALWRAMVNVFTNEYKLNNLIWVLGYADDVREGWDPGESFFDIAGSDTYRSETTHAVSYQRLRTLYSDKPLAFHECGLMPKPQSFFEEGAPWSWLMPWHGWNMMANGPKRFREGYADPRAITLERVPAF
ncbi:MAG: mannan endo-1,4-beta-mannosidase A and B [Clostridia bacterium]|nr:mannan endo-1,4-beta-mannosidase A and B [Clostridia bacterium]